MEYTDVEKVQNGEQDLYDAYRDGRSIEELNDMLIIHTDDDSSYEGVGDTVESVQVDSGSENETDTIKEEQQAEPYRVYQTHEDFQKDFDFHWNKRHRETKEKQEKQMREHQEQMRRMEEVQNLLADVLGVSKENAFEELSRRRYAIEAEKAGVENTEQYADMKIAQEEAKRLREQVTETNAQMEVVENARRAIEDIRRQGVELSEKVSGFNLDEAMQNEEFKQTVFALHRAGDTQAVAKAHRAVFFYEEKKEEPAVNIVKESAKPVNRPKESGASHSVTGQVKPIDFSRMSSRDILEMEKRVLAGEKIM